MTNNRRAATAKRPNVRIAGDAILSSPGHFMGMTGRWATQRWAKARAMGQLITANTFRTLDTLKHEEWQVYDKVVLEETVKRLVGVNDLIADGSTKPIANALGKMVYAYEKVSDMDDATVSLDGLPNDGTPNDVQEFDFNQMPLPIAHKDFFVNLRKLEASREGGESIDTLNLRTATRKVAEKMEKLLFLGGPTYGGLPIYGYTTEPNRNHAAFDGGKDWGDATKAGTSYKTDVLTMITALQADGFYGPYRIYVSTDAGIRLDDDYNPGTSDSRTIRQRLLQIEGVASIKTADQLTASNVIMAQTSEDVAAWIRGLDPTTVQWDEAGGFKVNFKVFAIGVPLIRSTLSGKSGVFHMSDAG